MNYLIDCGFSTGPFSTKILNELRAADANLSNWTLFGFEPDARWQDRWPAFIEEYPELSIKIYPAAIWTADAAARFYPCRSQTASHLADVKQRCIASSRNNSTVVPTVDLNKFILGLPNPERIILKLDIEGAEFYVLPHMQAGGSANLLSEVYIEYHERLNRQDWLPVLEKIKNWWAAHPGIIVHNWR